MKNSRDFSLSRKLRRTAWFGEAAICLALARLLIIFVPFRSWRKLIGVNFDQTSPMRGQLRATPADIERARGIGRRVKNCAARLPFRAVCLPQAMAVRWMLALRGIQAQLFIGARRSRNDEAQFAFHAWLMLEGACVSGKEEREQFQAFSRRSSTQLPKEQM